MGLNVMTTPERRVFLLATVALVGSVATGFSVADRATAGSRVTAAIASAAAAIIAGGLVYYFRRGFHRSVSSDSHRWVRWIAPAASGFGVVLAMLVPRSSFDPVVAGALTGLIFSAVLTSPKLGVSDVPPHPSW